MLKHSLLLLALVCAMSVAQAADKADSKANKQAAPAASANAEKGKAEKRQSDEHKLAHACDKKAKSARAGDAVARKKLMSDCRKA